MKKLWNQTLLCHGHGACFWVPLDGCRCSCRTVGRRARAERESLHGWPERRPQLRVDRWPLGWEHFLRNLTSIYPLYYYEIYNLKKKVEMPSPFEGKRVLYCTKQRLCVLIPHCLNSSLAGRVSDIPDTGHSVCGEGFPRGSEPCVKASSQCTGDCAKLSTAEHPLVQVSLLLFIEDKHSPIKKKRERCFERN